MPLLDSSCISAPDVDEDTPEQSVLGLASDFDSSAHSMLELLDVAKQERKLWEGVAHETIALLKEQIKYKKCFIKEKAKHIHGVASNTRSNNKLKRHQKMMERTADRYNLARERMLRLGLSPDDPDFQPITKSDLWMNDITVARNRKGGRKRYEERIEPWFWRSAGNNTSEEKAEWSIECMCLKPPLLL